MSFWFVIPFFVFLICFLFFGFFLVCFLTLFSFLFFIEEKWKNKDALPIWDLQTHSFFFLSFANLKQLQFSLKKKGGIVTYFDLQSVKTRRQEGDTSIWSMFSFWCFRFHVFCLFLVFRIYSLFIFSLFSLYFFIRKNTKKHTQKQFEPSLFFNPDKNSKEKNSKEKNTKEKNTGTKRNLKH